MPPKKKKKILFSSETEEKETKKEKEEKKMVRWLEQTPTKSAIRCTDTHVSFINGIRRTMLMFGTSWRGKCIVNKNTSVTSSFCIIGHLELLPVHVPACLLETLQSRALTNNTKCQGCRLLIQQNFLFPEAPATYQERTKTSCENCSLSFRLTMNGSSSSLLLPVTSTDFVWQKPSWYKNETKEEPYIIKNSHLLYLTASQCLDLVLIVTKGSKTSHSHVKFIPTTTLISRPFCSVKVNWEDLAKNNPKNKETLIASCPRKCFRADLEVINEDACIDCTKCRLAMQEIEQSHCLIVHPKTNEHLFEWHTTLEHSKNVLSESLDILMKRLSYYRDQFSTFEIS